MEPGWPLVPVSRHPQGPGRTASPLPSCEFQMLGGGGGWRRTPPSSGPQEPPPAAAGLCPSRASAGLCWPRRGLRTPTLPPAPPRADLSRDPSPGRRWPRVRPQTPCWPFPRCFAQINSSCMLYIDLLSGEYMGKISQPRARVSHLGAASAVTRVLILRFLPVSLFLMICVFVY